MFWGFFFFLQAGLFLNLKSNFLSNGNKDKFFCYSDFFHGCDCILGSLLFWSLSVSFSSQQQDILCWDSCIVNGFLWQILREQARQSWWCLA